MKRNILVTVVICVLMILSQFSFSFANVQKINNLEEFKNKINELYEEDPSLNPESIEIKELVENTDPLIINNFIEEKLNIIDSKMVNINLMVDEKTIDLGDNCYLKINNIDNDMTIRPFANTPGGQTLWKDYGSRKLTSTFEGNLGVAYFQFNICNHYTLNSNGISPRYVEAWANSSGIINISVGNVNEPKRYASIGETVSSNCIFTIKAAAGILQYDKLFKMYNYVKCSDIDTIEKQVKVVQSWRGDWL